MGAAALKLLGAVPLRWWLYLAGAAMIGYLVWSENHQTRRANRLAAEVTELRGVIESKDRAEKRQKEVSDEYHRELESLKRARADTPVRVVRLCQPAARVPEAAAGAPAASAAGLPEAPRRDPEAGPDIGHELYALADQADETAAQCNSLIRWDSSQ